MKVIDLVTEKSPKTIGDYLQLSREIDLFKKQNASTAEPFKIAILTSFTSKGIKEVLQVKIAELGVTPEIYTCDYQQYAQDILNADSELYKFSPQVVFLFIDLAHLAGDFLLNPYALSDEQRKAWVEEKTNEVRSLLDTLQNNSSAIAVVHNFETPAYSPIGILENKQNFGLVDAIETLNQNLRDYSKDKAQVFIFDFNNFTSLLGKNHLVDTKLYFSADIKLRFDHLPALAEEYLSYIKPLIGKVKKCIVLDLDNTLWGGIVGEDGINGIRLGPTAEGRPFVAFQQALLALHQRGILLAINSKNNQADAMEIFNNHPYMVLKVNHFSAMQINWENKVSNMKAIARELNIGLDSLVFFDDDELNCKMLTRELPEVLTICLPKDPALYLQTLTSLREFNTFQITAEDKKRSQQYAEERHRKELREKTVDISQYLSDLKMKLKFQGPSAFNIPRLAQMSQKTNQFNTTTRRYSEEQISNFAKSDRWLIISADLKDRFGDYGITGLALVEKTDSHQWRIDLFLMSCRIIGRAVEKSMLTLIIEKARSAAVSQIIAEFIPTAKNDPAKDFYKTHGFTLKEVRNETEIWIFKITESLAYPHCFEITTEV